MATLTDFAKIRYSSYGESFDPSVERTDMERGVPKQRLLNSQVMMKIQATLLFKTPTDLNGFEAWYFDEIKRIGWFTIQHPRTGAEISVRFENGSIGTLTSESLGFYLAQRQVVLEYLR